MFDGKWKFLVASIIVYQGLLTWCLFDLVDTASYFARGDCGDRCRNTLFGFILTNQGAHDTASLFAGISLLLIVLNVVVWTIAAMRRRGGSLPSSDA